MHSILQTPNQLFHDLIATLVPATCRLCAGPLDKASAVPVCTACLHSLAAETTVGCAVCGEAAEFAVDLEDLRFASSMREQILCRECRLVPPAYTRAVSFGTYAGELRGLIGLFKFNRVRAASRLLGPKLAEAVLQLEGIAGENLLVVAVPLFRAAAKARGFNQSELLADEAVKHLRRLRPGWKLTPAHDRLARRRSTDSSFGLSRSGRRRNLAGAFEALGDVRGREVLLVDDILTTGATARECAKVLVRAGAAKVFVATLARSQKGSVRLQYQQQAEVARWDLPAATNKLVH